MMKKLFAALTLVGALLYWPPGAEAQTPHLNCDAAANNASAYVNSNSADDCLDAAINDADAITAFATDANDSLTSAQIRGGGYLDISSTATLTATRTLDMPNSIERRLTIKNSTTGDQSITISQNSGRTVTIPPGVEIEMQFDGTNVDAVSHAGFGDASETTSVSGDRYMVYDASANSFGWVDHANMPGSGGGGGSALDTGDWITLEELTLSGASDNFAAFDPTLYREYEISLLDVRFDTADGMVALRFSDDACSTFEAGASDYRWNYHGYNDGGTEFGSAAGLFDTADSEIEGPITDFATADASQYGYYRIGPLDSGGDKQVISDITLWDSTAGNTARVSGHGTFYGNTNNIDCIQLLALSTATFSNGTAVLRARPKSPPLLIATVQTTDATQTQIAAPAVASGSSLFITVRGIGREDSTGDTLAQTLRNVCRNEAGTTTCATAQEETEMSLGSPVAGWDFDISADDTNDTADVLVTGESANTIDWTVYIELVEQQ